MAHGVVTGEEPEEPVVQRAISLPVKELTTIMVLLVRIWPRVLGVSQQHNLSEVENFTGIKYLRLKETDTLDVSDVFTKH